MLTGNFCVWMHRVAANIQLSVWVYGCILLIVMYCTDAAHVCMLHVEFLNLFREEPIQIIDLYVHRDSQSCFTLSSEKLHQFESVLGVQAVLGFQRNPGVSWTRSKDVPHPSSGLHSPLWHSICVNIFCCNGNDDDYLSVNRLENIFKNKQTNKCFPVSKDTIYSFGSIFNHLIETG